MKTMLYADLFTLKQSLKAMLFMLVIFIAVSLMGGGIDMLNVGLTMISFMMPLTLCSADKAYGWDRLSLSLPVRRKDVVGSKFAISLFANLVCLALSVLVNAAYCLAGRRAGEIWGNVCASMVCECVLLILMGLAMVLSFKYGVEKTRYIIIAAVWLPIMVVFMLQKAGVPLPGLGFLDKAVEALPGAAAFLGLAAGLLAYALFYLAAVRVFQKKEI